MKSGRELYSFGQDRRIVAESGYGEGPENALLALTFLKLIPPTEALPSVCPRPVCDPFRLRPASGRLRRIVSADLALLLDEVSQNDRQQRGRPGPLHERILPGGEAPYRVAVVPLDQDSLLFARLLGFRSVLEPRLDARAHLRRNQARKL